MDRRKESLQQGPIPLQTLPDGMVPGKLASPARELTGFGEEA